MSSKSDHLLMLITVMCFTMIVSGACANRYLNRPKGERIASCTGRLDEYDQGRVSFRFDLYRMQSGEMELFASFPGDGIWYCRIDDVNFDGGALRIELAKTSRVYEGDIVGDLKFDGSWNGMAATFKLKMDD